MNKTLLSIMIAFFTVFIITTCNNDNPIEAILETMTDIDGNTYQIVKIGNQWWMAENLKVTHYRNGDPIPLVTDSTEWAKLYCAYDNADSIANTYGYLFNWYAVADSRNIAPTGWHVPTDDEWKELEIYLGMDQSEADKTHYRGTNEGGKLKENGTNHWKSPNVGATNESGFTALPGGYRNGIYPFFYGLHELASFSTATEHDSNSSWHRILRYGGSDIRRHFENYKKYGLSVRLIRD